MPDLDLDAIEEAAERAICTTTGGTGDAMTIIALVAELRAAHANQEPAADADHERLPSPYDTLGQTLWKILGDQIHDAITSPAFASALRSAGIAVTPACDGVPEQPELWANYALDLFGLGREMEDPRSHIEEMWRLAYEAGWQGYAAQRGDLKAELEQWAALTAELRRQLDAQLLQVGRLRWLARYLPYAIRGLALRGLRVDERVPAESVEWAHAADQRAADAGLIPYPEG